MYKYYLDVIIALILNLLKLEQYNEICRTRDNSLVNEYKKHNKLEPLLKSS